VTLPPVTISRCESSLIFSASLRSSCASRSKRGSVQSMIGLEGVSMFWAYLALPVGAVFSMIGIIGNWLDPKRMELESAQ
jgi:TRAP-type C4-dicarboxylate transport system permease small subunit